MRTAFVAIVLCAATLSGLSCGCSGDARPRDPAFCAAVRTTLLARTKAHEVDRPYLNANSAAPFAADYGRFYIASRDLGWTHRWGVRLGSACVSPERSCRPPIGIWVPEVPVEEIAGAFERLRELADALDGRGRCARADHAAGSRKGHCIALAMSLDIATAYDSLDIPGEVVPAIYDLSLSIASGEDESAYSERFHRATSSMEVILEWRSLATYARDLLPLCASPAVARSCVAAAADLFEATPPRLRQVLLQFRDAIERGRPCGGEHHGQSGKGEAVGAS